MLGKVNEVKYKEPARMQPPVFPLGMRFRFAKNMCILDFWINKMMVVVDTVSILLR